MLILSTLHMSKHPEEVRLQTMHKMSIPGKGNSRCEGLELGINPVFSKVGQEASTIVEGVL